jgi:hypothetical protein
MQTFHLAQVNIGVTTAPMDSPQLAGFVALLPTINALADASPGFVWRLVDDGGADATGLRPWGGDTMVNMSVWESIDALADFVYRSQHLEPLRRRREWFVAPTAPYQALWWIPAGQRPTTAEARERLDLLAEVGAGPAAFTLREPFPSPELEGVETAMSPGPTPA